MDSRSRSMSYYLNYRWFWLYSVGTTARRVALVELLTRHAGASALP